MKFKDYFSSQAKEYSASRPRYPQELFEYLSSLNAKHDLAWDSACGNGQAAVQLAKFYKQVIATDASKAQIDNAIMHPAVKYYAATAEKSGLEDSSADIITAATAIHFFDHNKFYSEVNRILKPGGIIAVWNYAHSNISPEIDKVVYSFAADTLKNYWPEETLASWDFEKNIPFPFKRIKTPEFNSSVNWSLIDLLNYAFTWSAVQNFIKENGGNPTEILYDRLKTIWGKEDIARKIAWKLNMKIGIV